MEELPDLGRVFGVDFAKLAKAAERQAAEAAELQRRLAGLVGHAESADGRVSLTFSPAEGLPELRLDPRVLRLGSEGLAETIQAVVRKAVQDLDQQKQQIAKEILGSDFDPAEATPDPAAMASALDGVAEAVESAGDDLTKMVEQLRRRLEG